MSESKKSGTSPSKSDKPEDVEPVGQDAQAVPELVPTDTDGDGEVDTQGEANPNVMDPDAPDPYAPREPVGTLREALYPDEAKAEGDTKADA